MKPKYFLMALLLFVLSMGVHAAGGPMNENFTDLIALSNDAIETGQQGDKQAFIDKIKLTLEVLKTQDEKGGSIRLQRANEQLKAALKAAKDGDLKKGIGAIEEGIAIMKTDK